MIKVKIVRNNNYIKNIIINGHANYDKFGKDIVCSSVSSIAITTINAILTFDKNYIEYIVNDGSLNIIVKENNLIVGNLISNMLNMLNELKNDYPKNIMIKEENS